jgi:predicted GNAT family acetyltransferase
MHVKQFSSVDEFASLVVPVLEASEAENNLPLGIIGAVQAGEYRDRAPFFAVVHEGPVANSDSIVAIALRTPPFPVLIALTPGAANREAARLLVAELHRVFGAEIAGFNADARIGPPYVEAWAELTGVEAVVHMQLRIFKCSAVKPTARVAGIGRSATTGDRGVLETMATGFYRDALPDEYDPKTVETFVERNLTAHPSQRGLLLWDVNGEVVSMAAYTGPTLHGIRIGAVYTPPEHRSHGYASACVAELTRQLLQQGREFCFLFTDLSNPTSNKIYREIGYEPVSDHVYWKV